MNTESSRTLQIVRQFDQAFAQYDASLLVDLVGEDCVMESVEPAPDGTRYVGRAACLAFWRKLAGNRDGRFDTEEILAAGEHAVIRWRYRFGMGLSRSVRGVTVMRVHDDVIVEARGYVKSGDGEVATAVRSATSPR